jgi:hypothetical protein
VKIVSLISVALKAEEEKKRGKKEGEGEGGQKDS